MLEGGVLHLCFVRGLNVFGRGKISVPEQKARCSTVFGRSGKKIEFIIAHTNTGNLAVLAAPEVTAGRVQHFVTEALGQPCAVVNESIIDRMTTAFETWPAPPREEQQRWTPGFALLCEGSPLEAELGPTRAGVFKILDDSTVIVYRRDLETAAGVLDNAPKSRAGGWGAISARVDRGLGGLWTARSLVVGKTLLERARASGDSE